MAWRLAALTFGRTLKLLLMSISVTRYLLMSPSWRRAEGLSPDSALLDAQPSASGVSRFFGLLPDPPVGPSMQQRLYREMIGRIDVQDSVRCYVYLCAYELGCASAIT